ncbi:hypothetical protein BS47DRAFT_476499 [Hydnum rufescens UP504]|uniref:Uncharacterized protein n=1 Tax=Hydnum rufescens UP504 TaxID=1448309 RepID=A0A9P6B5J8_9AGAM|nr:hypothetical protein BS47DRAFT_476499 [Hydnum rufescens UP504]
MTRHDSVFQVGSPRALLKVTASSSTETNPDICLLEKAFTDFLRDRTRKSKQHGLTTFTAWARMENIDSTISQNVGPVASTTLYRVTRGVIRHEFTIIGFHSGEAAMSWLRTERTARVKEGWINPDSFGPVFSGVEARDLVSFASSKEALIGRNVEEVAEVVNLENEPTIIRNGIYLSELAESLAAVSNHYPRRLLQVLAFGH